ncbi:MAG: hypothetical protein ACI8RZ_001175 [Myxococcota bacterium]|jgi:hypothetical protein
MMRIWIVLPFLAACNGKSEQSGACLTYSEEIGDSGMFGAFTCLEKDSENCGEEEYPEFYSFHSGETCEEQGYTEDCGWGGEIRYQPSYCDQFSS